MFEFELGVVGKDRVSGFKGLIVGRAEYLTGCKKYALQPMKLTKEGKTPEVDWYDEMMVDIVKGKGIKKETKKDEPGGPMKFSPPKA